MPETFSQERSKKLKILLMGVAAIIVGVSILLLKPSQKVEKTGGFITPKTKSKIQLVDLSLSKKSISEGGLAELRILVRNNDNITHNVSVEIEHNQNIKIGGYGIATTRELTTLNLGELPPTRGIDQSLEVSGSVGNFTSSTEYLLKLHVIADSKELATKEIGVKVSKAI